MLSTLKQGNCDQKGIFFVGGGGAGIEMLYRRMYMFQGKDYCLLKNWEKGRVAGGGFAASVNSYARVRQNT